MAEEISGADFGLLVVEHWESGVTGQPSKDHAALLNTPSKGKFWRPFDARKTPVRFDCFLFSVFRFPFIFRLSL